MKEKFLKMILAWQLKKKSSTAGETLLKGHSIRRLRTIVLMVSVTYAQSTLQIDEFQSFGYKATRHFNIQNKLCLFGVTTF